MSVWPATLPQDFMADASVGDDESRLISQMDAGPASVRNRFTAVSRSVKTSMVLTGAQLVAFNTFFRTTLQQGTLSFTWIAPDTGSAATLRFRKKPEWQCVRPSSDPSTRLWQGSFELEILP